MLSDSCEVFTRIIRYEGNHVNARGRPRGGLSRLRLDTSLELFSAVARYLVRGKKWTPVQFLPAKSGPLVQKLATVGE